MKFQSIFASVLSVACAFCVHTSFAATTPEPITENVSRTLTHDEEYDLKKGALTINDGVTIDLAGYSLTYNNVGSFAGTGTITDTSDGNPGELHLSPSSAQNCALNLSGNLRLIKEGSSTLTMTNAKTSYSGGTAINAGTLKIGTATQKFSDSFMPLGASGSVIAVYDGGTFDANGKYGWSGVYSIEVYGGKFGSSGARNDVSKPFNPDITLYGDAEYFETSSSGYTLAGNINMNSHKLTVTIKNTVHFLPTTISNGTIDYSAGGSFILEKDLDMTTVNLKIAAPLNLQTFTLDVLDFEPSVAPSGDGKVVVHGTLKPVQDVVPVCTLASWSKIDLSGVTFPCDLTKVTLDADVSELEVSLGDKTPDKGDPIADFGRALPGVKISFKNDETPGVVTSAGILTYGTSTAPVAKWTGAASDGDVDNAENWAGGTKPTADIDAVFSGNIGKLSIPAGKTLDWSKVTFDNVALTEDCDLSGLNPDIVSALSVIDVDESTLTFAGKDGAYECAAEITTESETGKLRIVVPENASYTNSAFKMTGKLSLVKEGLGTLVAADDKDFEGELIVNAGKLECGLANLSGRTPFGTGCTIALENGGVLDPKGAINWSAQTIKCKGGKIVNTVKATGVGTGAGTMVDYKPAGITNSTPLPFNPKLILLADTTIESTEDFNFQGKVDDSEYALHLQIPQGHYFLWRPNLVTNLKLDVAGCGSLGTLSKAPVVLANQPGIQLTMSGAALVLPVHNSYGSGTMDVTDYTSACTNSPTITGAALNVYGTFTPAAVDEDGNEYFYGCTMQSGSKIDLSAKTEVWNVKSASVGNNTVKFAEGTSDALTQISVDLGSTRTFALGEKIVSWEIKPINVEFAFVCGDQADATPARVLADGLYYGEAKIEVAEWTGAKNGDLTDPANWKDSKLPDGEITAKFTGDISAIVRPESGTFTCKEFYFDNMVLSKETDLSWLDINKITDSSVVDISGQTLKISAANGISLTSATITDTVGGGTVEFSVEDDCVYTNTSLAFEGGLKFVKKGEGVFVAAKYPQLYTGLTEVAEGVLRCGVESVVADGKTPFGTSLTIEVVASAALDPAGSYNWTTDFIINLNGGMISNTVARTGLSNDNYNAGSGTFIYPFNPTIKLTVDSLFASTANFNFKGILDSGDKKLEVQTKGDFRWFPTKAENADVTFTGTGTVKTLSNFAMIEPTFSLTMDGPTFDVGGNMAVSNYTAKSERGLSRARNANAWLNVAGTFKPVADEFFGCTMLDGSEIDLSDKEGVWSTTSEFNVPKDDQTKVLSLVTVEFAANATVTINVHGRKLKNNQQIISWTTKPENVVFKLDNATYEQGYRLNVKEGGVFVNRSGLLLILK